MMEADKRPRAKLIKVRSALGALPKRVATIKLGMLGLDRGSVKVNR